MIIPARLELANVYLNFLGNEKEFINCHKSILKISKTVDTLVSLGDAYMTIKSPAALDVYKQAASLAPNNELIIIRFGQALVMGSDNERALEMYEEVLRNHPGFESVRFELIKLYMDRNLHAKARSLLKKSLYENEACEFSCADQMTKRLSLLTMLADVLRNDPHHKSFRSEMSAVLDEAKEVCHRFIEITKDRPEPQLRMIDDQRKKLAGIFSMLAHCSEEESDLSRAELFLNEALNTQVNDEMTMLSLGSLYLKQGKFEECKQIAEKVMKISPDSEAALQLLGTLHMAQSKNQDAIVVFKTLLSMYPSNYLALSNCLCLQYREGKMEDIPDLIMTAEANCNHVQLNPGLLHAKVRIITRRMVCFVLEGSCSYTPLF